MNPPPNPAFSGSAAPLARATAFLAAAPDARPQPDGEAATLRVVSVHHRAGAEMHWAVLSDDLADGQRRLVDAQLSAALNRQVEIHLLREPAPGDESGPDELLRGPPLFWGEVVQQQLALAAGGEASQLVARIEPAHLGGPLIGMDQHDAPSGGLYVHHDAEFNPVVDGAREPNRYVPSGGGGEGYPLWGNPQAFRSETAREEQGGDVEEWTLPQILETLCGWLNADETYIRNLPRQVLELICEDAPEIRDVTLPRGKYLPELLDLLLPPLGYGWYLGLVDLGAGLRPQIRPYRRGRGRKKSILLQRPGEAYDRLRTNLQQLQLDLDISRLANVLVGEGALRQREFTLELYRTWGSNEDGQEDQADRANPIGRKWAANEAGDYTDLRDEIEAAPDLGISFLRGRRPAEDCLTRTEKKRRHAVPEYSEDDGETWLPFADNWQWRLLPDECGLYLTGQLDEDGGGNGIPDELLADGVRVRLTCTLTADTRIRHETPRAEASPNSKELRLTLDLSDRFADRQRQAEGEHASRFVTDPGEHDDDADERDDQEELEAYLDKLLENEQAAAVTATLPLCGLQLEYRIGDLIDRIEGRNVSLNRCTQESGVSRLLQVIGIDYVFEPEEQTILHVSAYDLPVPPPHS